MTFEEYEAAATTSRAYPNVGNNHVFPTLGLVEEAGEVAGKVKKLIRDHGKHTPADLTPEDIMNITKEMGDVLWYMAVLSRELKVPLVDIAEQNLAKIRDREARGMVGGSGDTR
jgi:NTP pyrophosphatase (non-canonical NTP hydrolase)